ncbi:hypothetical protein F8388_003023 [Cannabis sativa]|uniref:Reverse transcriptase zinc-binding domain-containing protein n=1 Tax=Cannabis sativa TaxID=3483 RepID=A0A7J6DYV7_CANSA|nr:hypothetical protein F8388_003023 [Cannabis sativa]
MDRIHPWWKMWWKLTLPPLMKLFGWKLCQNWLSAKTNLHHTGMSIDPTCSICAKYVESLSHALWTCDKVKTVWKLMPCYKLIKDSRGNSMMDLLVEFQQKLAKEEFEDVIKVLWAIWENRNRQWNHFPYMSGPRLLDWVFSSYPNSDCRENQNNQTSAPAAHHDRWLAPLRVFFVYTVMLLSILL